MIKIITDSGSEISEEISKKYDIEVLPILVNDGEVEYGLGELTSEEMFKNMRNKTIYKTSQVSFGDYDTCFRKYAKENKEIIYISLSSGITATFTQANNVKKEVIEDYPEAKIHIIDSKCVTMGMWILVIRAAIMAKEGKDSNEILNMLEDLKLKQEHTFSVTSFEFLLRGGRVSSTSATIGGLLNIKPVLEVSHEDGKLKTIDKARGEKALVKKFITIMHSKNYNPRQTTIISYGDDISFAKILGEKVIEEFGVKEENVIYNQLGCVVGAHTGPDFLAVFYLNELDNKYKNLFELEI